MNESYSRQFWKSENSSDGFNALHIMAFEFSFRFHTQI